MFLVNYFGFCIMSVSLNDFYPLNSWKIPEESPTFINGEKCYIQDQTTGRLYLNDTKQIVRVKCALLTLGTPIVHTAAAIINLVVRVFKVISLQHFWGIGSKAFNLKAQIQDFSEDLIRIVATPLFVQLSAIYGILNPYDGRKLYASLERFYYNDSFNLAPCFQPDPLKHFFGGNMDTQNAF